MKKFILCIICLGMLGCAPETYSAYRVEGELKLAQELCSSHMGVARYGFENNDIRVEYPITDVYCNDESSFDISFDTSKYSKNSTK